MSEAMHKAMSIVFEAAEYNPHEIIATSMAMVTATLQTCPEDMRQKWLNLIIEQLTVYKASGTASFAEALNMGRH